MLQLSKKMLIGTEHAHQDICVTAQAAAAQLCPAAVQQLQALTNTMGMAPHPADCQGMHPDHYNAEDFDT